MPLSTSPRKSVWALMRPTGMRKSAALAYLSRWISRPLFECAMTSVSMVAADGSAHGLLRHAVALDDAALALGLRTGMAAHGGDDERMRADGLDLIPDGADDAGDVRHVTAACGDADAVAGLDAVERALALHSLAQRRPRCRRCGRGPFRGGRGQISESGYQPAVDQRYSCVILRRAPVSPGHGLHAVSYASSGMR